MQHEIFNCKICNQSDVICIKKEAYVKFVCKDGHSWTESYTDQGGIHQRPTSYDIGLQDVLFVDEKKLFKKVLREIEKKPEFFQQASAQAMADYLSQQCQCSLVLLHRLFRKIEKYGM